MKKFFTYLFLVIGISGGLVSFALIFEGLQPCSGDGCIVRIALFIGTVSLLISSIFVILSLRTIKREKNNQ